MTIKELRKKHNLTQQQLADLLDVPKRTIENWEGGKSECKPYILNLIDHALTFMPQHEAGTTLHVSYESSELIAELEADIAEFGLNEPCLLFWQTKQLKIPFSDQTIGVEFIINYDFVDEEQPLNEEETAGLRMEISTFGKALEILKKQNSIF